MTELKEQQDTALPMGCTQEQIDALGAEGTPRCCVACKHWYCGYGFDGIGVCLDWLRSLNTALDNDEEKHVSPGWVLLCTRAAEDGEECDQWEEYR